MAFERSDCNFKVRGGGRRVVKSVKLCLATLSWSLVDSCDLSQCVLEPCDGHFLALIQPPDVRSQSATHKLSFFVLVFFLFGFLFSPKKVCASACVNVFTICCNCYLWEGKRD